MNSTAWKALEEYPGLASTTVFLFPESLTQGALSERALGSLVQKVEKIAWT